jgi:hypothetical protein
VPIAPAPLPNGTQDASLPSDPTTGLISIWTDPTNLPSSDSKAFWDTSIWYDNGTKTASNSNPDGSVAAPHSRGGPTFDDVGSPSKSHSVSFDNNMSAAEVMKQYAAMSQRDPLGFAAIQKELQAAGFYGASTTAVLGGFNSQTEKALADAMYQYIKVAQGSGTPVNFSDFLRNTAAANQGINGNVPGASGGSSTPILTDPDTLTRYAQMAAQAALGRSLSKQELNSFVDQFHQQQVQSYTDAANHNGLSSMKDDPRASAIGFVTSTNKPEFEQHQIQGYTDSFLNMFLPSSTSAAPSPTMDPQGIGY